MGLGRGFDLNEDIILEGGGSIVEDRVDVLYCETRVRLDDLDLRHAVGE